MDKNSLKNNFIYKVNQWLNLHYEEDYDHRYIVTVMLEKILNFLSKNKLSLTCDEDVFIDYFIEYLYEYSSHKYYSLYNHKV